MVFLKSLFWAVIAYFAAGFITGFFFGSCLLSYGISLTLGILAFISAMKNDGKAPSWLWRSRKRKKQDFEISID